MLQRVGVGVARLVGCSLWVGGGLGRCFGIGGSLLWAFLPLSLVLGVLGLAVSQVCFLVWGAGGVGDLADMG